LLALAEGFGGMAQAKTRVSTLRRAAGVVVVLGFLVLALEFHRLAPALPRSAAAQPQNPVSVQPQAPVSTPGVTPGPTSSPSSATPSPTPPKPSSVPSRSGKQAGILIIARPTSVGSFDVIETVVFDSPTNTLTFAVPDPVRLDPQFRRNRPLASNVRVDAGGERVVVPHQRVSAQTTVATEAPVDQIELHYRLSGVVNRSTPAPAGRALAALGPLTAGVPAELPVRIVVLGREVRNLQCPHLPLAEQACAAGSRTRMRVNRALPWQSAMVLVQLDLPRSS
jgi:hypothetical protein